jgi:hypothetical protein
MTTEGYELFKRWLRAAGGPEKPPPPFGVLVNAVLARYFNSYLTACDGRRFFSTVERRIGLGPSGIKHGDDVVFFSMAQFPLYSAKKR